MHTPLQVRLTLIGILALRAFQTWRSVIHAKITMDDFIRTTLYCRSQDSQRGVLLSIQSSIEQVRTRAAAPPLSSPPLHLV